MAIRHPETVDWALWLALAYPVRDENGLVSTQSELTTLPHLKTERLKIANQRTYSFRLCPGTKKLGLSRKKRSTEQTEHVFSKHPAANLGRVAQQHHKGLQGLQWRVARSCGVWALPEMVIHNASDPALTIGGILWPHQVVKKRVLWRPCVYDVVWCCMMAMVLWIYTNIHEVIMMFVLYYVRLCMYCLWVLICRVLKLDCGGTVDFQITVGSNVHMFVTLFCRKAKVCILPVNSQRRVHELLRLWKIIDNWRHELMRVWSNRELTNHLPRH